MPKNTLAQFFTHKKVPGPMDLMEMRIRKASSPAENAFIQHTDTKYEVILKKAEKYFQLKVEPRKET